MALKITMFFQLNGQGWSETYWNEETDPVALANDNQPVGAAADSIITQRLKLLSPLANCTHMRVSVDGKFRQEWGVDYPQPQGNGTATRAFLGIVGVGAEPVLPPSVRVEVQTAATPVASPIVKRRNYLGGVPGDLMTPNGQLNRANPNWFTILKDFFTAGKHRPFCLRTRGSVTTGKNLTQFTPSADAYSAQVAPNVLANVVDTVGQVIISRVKEPHGWNGVHRAQTIPDPINPGQFLLTIGPRRKQGVTIPVWNVIDGGVITAFTTTLVQITLVAAENLVKKSTGRPFGVPVGRRSSA